MGRRGVESVNLNSLCSSAPPRIFRIGKGKDFRFRMPPNTRMSATWYFNLCPLKDSWARSDRWEEPVDTGQRTEL